MEMRLTRDPSADPPDHLALGTPENIDRWLASNRDLAALHGPLAYGVCTTIARFTAMRASYVRSIVGGSSAGVRRMLEDFVPMGLVVRFEGRRYVDQSGMLRPAPRP